MLGFRVMYQLSWSSIPTFIIRDIFHSHVSRVALKLCGVQKMREKTGWYMIVQWTWRCCVEECFHNERELRNLICLYLLWHTELCCAWGHTLLSACPVLPETQKPKFTPPDRSKDSSCQHNAAAKFKTCIKKPLHSPKNRRALKGRRALSWLKVPKATAILAGVVVQLEQSGVKSEGYGAGIQTMHSRGLH